MRVLSRRGAAEGLARTTESIRADTVFMPFHWGGVGSVNRALLAALIGLLLGGGTVTFHR